MRGALVLLVAAGCGDNIRPIASGERLAAIVESGGQGATTLAFFVDRETGVECTFAPDRAGTWRCLPRHAASIAGYADAACSLPIYECHECGDARAAVVHETGCAFAVAQPVLLADSAPPPFLGGAFGCVSASVPPGPYFTASEDDPARFVSAAFDVEELDFRFGRRTLVADDGARQLHHGFRRSDDATCTFGGSTTTPRCLPGTPAQTERGLAYFYAEDTCATRLALREQRAGCEPTTHVRIDGDVHVLTAPAPSAFERSAVDSRCFPTLETDVQFWTIGPVDLDLPRAALYALGHAAARPVFFAADGQPMQFARRWVDSDERTCFAHPTLAAGRRCIPRAQTLTDDPRYADAACTQRIVDNADAVSYAIRWEGIADPDAVTADSVVSAIYLLRSYPGTEVYAQVAGTCTLQPESALLMAYVEDAVDPVTFPPLERRPVEE